MSRRHDERLVPVTFLKPENRQRTNLELADMIERGYSFPAVKKETYRAFISANYHMQYGMDWPIGEWRCCPVGAALIAHHNSVVKAHEWLETVGDPIGRGALLLRVEPYLLAAISSLNMGGRDRKYILNWLIHQPDRTKQELHGVLADIHSELQRDFTEYERYAYRRHVDPSFFQYPPMPRPRRLAGLRSLTQVVWDLV